MFFEHPWTPMALEHSGQIRRLGFAASKGHEETLNTSIDVRGGKLRTRTYHVARTSF
jgi:hypothetical protein